MKSIKLGLRIWIAIVSAVSFLGGWALLSHAAKPAPLFNQANQGSAVDSLQPLPTLQPVPSFDDMTGSLTIQQLPALPDNSAASFFPRLRTMGS